MVGLNQIATVFNLEYQQYLNLETYDRIRRYYFNEEEVATEQAEGNNFGVGI
jgi:hypothetical protein